jgi:hypothetical protein
MKASMMRSRADFSGAGLEEGVDSSAMTDSVPD